MAAIKILVQELKALSSLNEKELEEILSSIGVPIESKTTTEWELEITPNRPDLLSVEGLARACYCFKYSKLKPYRAIQSDLNLFVDSSTKNVRPYIGGALIKNLKLDQNFLNSLIQLQEKIHQTLGRKRKKVAIGLHDISKAQPPFFYYATSSDIKFVPLGFDRELSCSQILTEHPKGQEYGHLIKGKYPILEDSKKNVLSFPPIINGEFSKVSLDTHTLFIDCTGTDEKTILFVVNILCAVFADRGAQVYQIKINKKPYPLFKELKTKYNFNFSNKILGLNLSLKKHKSLLLKMGHKLQKNFVLSPSFRADILDTIDIVEDLAIAYGYNNFKPTLPDFFSIGQEEKNYDWLAQLLVGAGFLEVCSWILTNKNVLHKAECSKAYVEVSNPLTEEFSTLRNWLYPNFLEIFSISKSSKMPQKIFEIGPVFIQEENKIIQKTNCCFAICSPKANLTELISTLKSIFSLVNLDYKLEKTSNETFIEGRIGKILINKKPVGLIGEIHPKILENFSIEQPVVVCEFCLDELNL
ncbi:MAG: phenylalanine--tRNA ligase subunit beta [Candidatus Micrarchaeota archaeon]|nr:phenylalanine--tRNA ligase subunit beta [Candidatus Micrarchaeota archaeon]